MRTAIENYLEREEKFEREKREDLERWEHYQLTGEAVSHDAVVKWLEDLAHGVTTPCPK